MSEIPKGVLAPEVVGSLAMMREVTPADPQGELQPGSEAELISPTDTASFKIAPAAGAIKLVEGAAFRVGRASGNDLPLKDADVSRFHAVFYASKAGIVVSDLSSLNGTFVNEKRISAPVDLHSGDTVRIGRTRFLVTLERAYPDPTVSQDHTQLVGMRAVDITVLLVDICRYTTMSQKLPADDVMAMLQNWCHVGSGIIRQHGGEVDKYLGDCIMAFWLSTREETVANAEKAYRAGQELLRRTELLSAEWRYAEEYPWRCRVVLNSGTAMMGVVAGGRGRDLTVLGDCVNVAFRLESFASKIGRMFVLSDTTAELLRALGSFELALDELGLVELEGRSGGTKTYGVSGY